MPWSLTVIVPYDSGWSKNRMWLHRGDRPGAKRLSPEARARRDGLVRALDPALAKVGTVRRNRLEIGIRVVKPDHRTDALNCLDLVADAVQIATGIDDRWFSLTCLTWAIDPTPGKAELFVTVSQDADEDVIACSACGGLLPEDRFPGKPVDQGVCRACTKAKRTRKRLDDAKRYERDAPPEPDPDPGRPPPWA